jgi:hypothetical protein
MSFIEVNLLENESLSVQVTDAFGRELLKSDVEGIIGANKFEWKINANIPSGWYFVTVKGKNGLRISKIEVLR